MDKKYTDITVIIDKSGSMSPLTEGTISGFNEFLKEQQGVEGKATLTLVQFDNEYEVTCSGQDIREVKELDTNTYVPRGTTALYDAVMRALDEMEARHKKLKKKSRPGQNVVVIITDGHENASSDFAGPEGAEKVQARIKKLQEDKDWKFTFFGANIDAKLAAGQLGIASQFAVQYQSTNHSVARSFATASSTIGSYRGGNDYSVDQSLMNEDNDQDSSN